MIPVFIFFLLIQPQFSLSGGCTRRPRSADPVAWGNSNQKIESYDHVNWKELNDPQCGLTNSVRIIGGEKAAMGAYPWLAMVGYATKGKEIQFRCGGSVISKWYIITAAHCAKDLSSQLKIVRLGEHNLKTNPDCEGEQFCNDPYKEYKVVEVNFHKSYDHPLLQNDIALLRVDREIEFTEFIKPICIPKGTLSQKNFTGLSAEVAGWGIYNVDQPKQSQYLLTVKLPIMDMSRCESYRLRDIPLARTQLCVGGIVGKDSCGGDSGGPLMRVDQDDDAIPGPRYYLLGIVSFGAARCGETDLPAIYTRITDFLPWILENIRS